MEKGNHTTRREFVIKGFMIDPGLRPLVFSVLLIVYLLIVCSNLTIIVTISADLQLKTPMYFLLQKLSILDIFSTSVTFPTLLGSFMDKRNSISFLDCMIQLYFFMALTCSNFNLLTAMACDRYVAICHPLRYTVIMNNKLCFLLAGLSGLCGFLAIVPHMFIVSELSFCGSNVINHFFCDPAALMTLCCSDTYALETTFFVVGTFAGGIPFLVTITSYGCIISVILKIHSLKGKCKAFSTCTSHLTVVTLFYGSVFGIYVRPASTYSLDEGKILTLMYIAFIPVSNPLIYSLRNKEMKSAIRKLVSGKVASLK